MLMRSTSAATFPSVQLHPDGGGLPIEVTLIARLERGSGDRLIDGVSARQRVHASFVDALDEPSARIGGIDLANGDVTSLYTFAVGKNGHPFHRHAGHRVFTAVSGGAGTRLRFSTASTGQLHRDPHAFLATLHHVDVPPDSMFVVRFGGGVWHQFIPLRPGTAHPALFALSCHTNELGGDLEPDLRRRVLRGAASIPAMTELLPTAVCALLESPTFDAASVPTTTLSLCERRPMWWRRSLPRLCPSPSPSRERALRVRELDAVPRDSLLRTQLEVEPRHEDTFELVVPLGAFKSDSLSTVLEMLLDGFLQNPPRGVSHLMALRNALVKPFGLRTSRLGCPVSSLLCAAAPTTFGGRFPVFAQRVDAKGMRAEVILGADDKHLSFRSCVGVERLSDGAIRCTLGTRVRTHNTFGRFYLAAIEHVHRAYIAPKMLRQAVEHALAVPRDLLSSTAENGESVGRRRASMSACRLPSRLLRASIHSSANARA